MNKDKITDINKRKRSPRSMAARGEPDPKEGSECEIDVSWLWDEPNDTDSASKMGKITSVSECEQNLSGAIAQGDYAAGDDLADIDNSTFWLDPPEEEQVETMTALPPERVVAIVVKGCFAIYHLVREHKRRRTRVPQYLLHLAREHENPLIPAAEALYVGYFEGGIWPDDIPDGLLELGSSTVHYVTECTRSALRLHRLLEAFGNANRVTQQKFFEIFPTNEGAMLLVQVMLAMHRSWSLANKRIKSV